MNPQVAGKEMSLVWLVRRHATAGALRNLSDRHKSGYAFVAGGSVAP